MHFINTFRTYLFSIFYSNMIFPYVIKKESTILLSWNFLLALWIPIIYYYSNLYIYNKKSRLFILNFTIFEMFNSVYKKIKKQINFLIFLKISIGWLIIFFLILV